MQKMPTGPEAMLKRSGDIAKEGWLTKKRLTIIAKMQCPSGLNWGLREYWIAKKQKGAKDPHSKRCICWGILKR